MKIIVISDVHQNISLLRLVLSMHPDADLYLDAGDSQMSADEIFPFLSVKGNNDYLIHSISRVVTLGDLRIWILHGHKSLLTEEVLVQTAKLNHCNMIIYGHTHIPFFSKREGIYILNPGSLSMGRSSMGNTYAVISFQTRDDLEIEWKTVSGEKL